MTAKSPFSRRWLNFNHHGEMKTKLIRQDKRLLTSICCIQPRTTLFWEGSPTILHSYSLKLGIAHFPNIQTAKPHCTTTAMYNRCAKAKENMHPFLRLEWTKQVTITSQQYMCMCPFAWLQRKQLHSSHRVKPKQEVKRISHRTASQGAQEHKTDVYLP